MKKSVGNLEDEEGGMLSSTFWFILSTVGDCAINGGVFKGAYASEEGIGGTLPVDFKVPGCPPTPDDLIKALLGVMGK